MKFSTCITNPNIINLPLNEILDFLVEAGFDGIDIPGEPELYPIEKIYPILESYSDKIQIGELTACINPTRDLSNPDEKKRKKAVDYIKYCIDSANKLENNLTHLCFITTETILNTVDYERLWKNAIESTKECVKHADNLGVKLMIEPLFKDDNSIINRCEQAVKLWCEVLDMEEEEFVKASKNYGLLQDIFHMHHEEENLLKTLKKYKNITYHYHIADHPRGLDFTRNDSIFAKTALKVLESFDYDGFISFESFDDFVTLETLAKGLKTLKNF